MQVVYENNLSDLIAANNDFVNNNSQFQNRKYRNLYGTPIFVFFGFSFFAYIKDEPSFYFGAFIGALASYFWTLFCYKKHPEKAAKEMSQKEAFCEHTIEITDEGVREKTTNSESYHRWTAINKISITKDYVFIYNTPITAHIIPKRVIGENEFIKVVNAVNSYSNT